MAGLTGQGGGQAYSGTSDNRDGQCLTGRLEPRRQKRAVGSSFPFKDMAMVSMCVVLSALSPGAAQGCLLR